MFKSKQANFGESYLTILSLSSDKHLISPYSITREYHHLLKHTGYENKGNDNQRKNALIYLEKYTENSEENIMLTLEFEEINRF